MFTILDDAVEELCQKESHIVHAPCLAHVIQLAVEELLSSLRIAAKNENVITVWDRDNDISHLHTDIEDIPGSSGSVAATFQKVCKL